MNLLITSTGRRTYMVEYFREALQGKGKVFAANSELTYALKKADEYVLTPGIYDDTYIDFLLDYCKENQINALISLFDIDLPVLSKHRSLFDAIGVKLLVSDYDFVSICNDKWKSYEFIKQQGFDTPKSFISILEVKDAIATGELRYPLILKPRWGMGSIGIYEAENEVELEVFYRKTKNAILKSYLKYESQELIDESIIIQEKIEGEEWGLDVFNDLSGEFLASVPKRKIAMRAGETDIASISKDANLIGLGKKISTTTRHIGNLDVDFFIKDGKFYILEFNCRFGGQYPFSHIAGVNFPLALVKMLSEEKPTFKELEFQKIMAFKDLIVQKI